MRSSTQGAALAKCVAKGEACHFESRTIIPSRLIMQLCTDPKTIAAELQVPGFRVTSFGIEIHNATIQGDLDLRSAKLEFGLRFYNCTFEGRVNFAGARIHHLKIGGNGKTAMKKGLSLENALVWEDVEINQMVFEAVTEDLYDASSKEYHNPDHTKSVLWARDAEINGSLVIRGCRVHGELFLAGTEVKGMLDISGTEFGKEGEPFGSKWAVFAFNTEVGGSVYLRRVTVHSKDHTNGEICFYGAKIQSRLSASLQGTGSDFTTLDFSEASLDGDVELSGCSISRCLLFTGAVVSGNVSLEKTKFTGVDNKGYSLVARDLVVSETLELGFEPTTQHGSSDSENKKTEKIGIMGSIDLTGAKIGRNLLLDNLHIMGKTGSRRRSLVAPAIQVGGALLLRYTTVEGGVDLRTAKIEGIVSFHGAQLNYDDAAQGSSQQGVVPFPSLGMRAASVGLDLLFGDEDYAICSQNYCFSAGRIRLDGMHVKGSLRFYKAQIRGELQAVGIRVDGDIVIKGTAFKQSVDLSGVEVGESLHVSAHNSQTEEAHFKHGIRLYNAVVKQDVVFTNIIFGGNKGSSGVVELVGSKIHGALALSGKCYLPIWAHNMFVAHDVFMTGEGCGFTAYKTIRLDGSEIKGNLDCRGGQFGVQSQGSNQPEAIQGTASRQTNPVQNQGSDDPKPQQEYTSIDAYCIYAAGVTVGQSIFLSIYKPAPGQGKTTQETKQFIAHGAVNFSDARVGRNFDCRGGVFQHNGERCLYAPRLEVAGRMGLCTALEDNEQRFTAYGTVRIPGAKIGGDLDCGGANFTNNKCEYSVYASGIEVDGSVYFNCALENRQHNFEAEGCVRIDGAKISKNLDCRGGQFKLNDSQKRIGSIPASSTRINQNESGASSVLQSQQTPQTQGALRQSTSYPSPAVYSLYAPNVRVGGNVYCGIKKENSQHTNFCAEGPVSFAAAKVEGNFDCDGGVFQHDGPRCLYAPLIEVGRRMRLGCDAEHSNQHVDTHNTKTSKNIEDCKEGKGQFVAEGTVRLEGAKIGGDLDCGGGCFSAGSSKSELPAFYSLYAPSIRIEGNLYLNTRPKTGKNFLSEGVVDLGGAVIRGRADFRGGKFNKYRGVPQEDQGKDQKRDIISLGGAHIGWHLLLCGCDAKGDINLRGATIRGNLDAQGAEIEGYLQAADITIMRSAYLGRLSRRHSQSADSSNTSNSENKNKDSISVRKVDLSKSEIGHSLEVYGVLDEFDLSNATVKGSFIFAARDRSGNAAANKEDDSSEQGKQFTVTYKSPTPPKLKDKIKLLLSYLKLIGVMRFESILQKIIDSGIVEGEVDSGDDIKTAVILWRPETGEYHIPRLSKNGKFTVNNISVGEWCIIRVQAGTGRVLFENPFRVEPGRIANLKLPRIDSNSSASTQEGSQTGEARNNENKQIRIKVVDKETESEIQKVSMKRILEIKFPKRIKTEELSKGNGSSYTTTCPYGEYLILIESKGYAPKMAKVSVEPANRDGGSSPSNRSPETVSLSPTKGFVNKWIFGRRKESHTETSCPVRINLQNASVDLWDDQFVFPKSGEENPNHTPFLCKMSREQILRAAAYDLSGFTYSTLGEHLLECIQKFPREVGLWLNFSKICTYDPQPYEHMAEVLKKHGEEAGYAAIVVAKRREHRQHVDPDGYLRWTIALVSLFGLILPGLLFPKHINLNPYWMCIIGAVGVVSMIFYLSARFLFKVLGLAFDFVFLHFPVHLIERPWRAPAYATVIWLTFSLSYAAIDAKKFMAPSEGHLQYYLTEGDKHYKELADLEREQSKRLDEILSVLSTQSDTSEKRVQDSNTPTTHAESHNEVSNQSKADVEWNPPRGYPEYNPFLYTLDRLVPFVEFAQSDAWIPDSSKTQGKILWYTDWFLRITGFYLVTVLLGAITGLVKVEKL